MSFIGDPLELDEPLGVGEYFSLEVENRHRGEVFRAIRDGIVITVICEGERKRVRARVTGAPAGAADMVRVEVVEVLS